MSRRQLAIRWKMSYDRYSSMMSFPPEDWVLKQVREEMDRKRQERLEKELKEKEREAERAYAEMCEERERLKRTTEDVKKLAALQAMQDDWTEDDIN